MNTLKTLSYTCVVAAVAVAVGLMFQRRTGVVRTRIENGATPRQIEQPGAQRRPRRVTEDQAATLIAELRGTDLGLVNVIYANCADCKVFKEDLVRALKMAGATIPDTESGSAAGLPGVIVFVPDLEHPSPEASELSAALQRAGIDARPGADPTSEFEVTLYVGREQ